MPDNEEEHIHIVTESRKIGKRDLRQFPIGGTKKPVQPRTEIGEGSYKITPKLPRDDYAADDLGDHKADED